MTDFSALVPPSDTEAEKWVLGSILLKPDLLTDLTGIVSAADFYLPGNRLLFETISRMHEAREQIDVGLVFRRLQADGNLAAVGGPERLGELAQDIPTVLHAEHYAAIVRKKAQLRAMVDLGHDLVLRAYDDAADPDTLLGDAARDLGAIPTGDGRDEPEEAAVVVPRLLAHIDAIGSRGRSAGLLIGLPDFDEALGGLFPGELIILAARPSVGKSALAGQVAAHAAAQGELVYVASLEMASEEWLQRILCADARVDSRLIRNGTLEDEHTARLASASHRVGRLNLRIDDRTDQRVIDIRRRALRLKRDGLALVVIDYLQLMKPADVRAPRHEQVASMSRGLKLLAKELAVPILCLCQLNREVEGKEGGSPQLSHLRESGAIEQDADVVAFIHQPDKATDAYRELLVRKNRNGPIGRFGLSWDSHQLAFSCCAAAEPPAKSYGKRKTSSANVAANPYASDFADLSGDSW